jgi:DNA-binding transcriptional ArsR family regulator
MASALPHQPAVEHKPQQQTDIVVKDDEQTEILQSLSSETAQAILVELRDEPATASEIADAVDTSLQNAHYHLKRLSDATLIEPVDTWYSVKGTEMTVYALTTRRLVIQFGGKGRRDAGSATDG